MSSNGFQTHVWGPPAWFFLHTITFNFPLNSTATQRRQYLQLFNSLKYTLPCRACRESYKHIVTSGNTKLNINVMKSRSSVSRWFYRVHNRVNKRIGSKNKKTYSEISKFYENIRASCAPGPTVHGCTQPTRGIKKRSIIHIVPRNCARKDSIQLHPRCKK